MITQFKQLFGRSSIQYLLQGFGHFHRLSLPIKRITELVSAASRPTMIAVNHYGIPKKCPLKIDQAGNFFLFYKVLNEAMNRLVFN